MEVRLLGNMEVRDSNGADVSGGPLKRRIVLATLALSPGVVVSNASLIDAVWGDDPPPSALGTLRSLIAGLRRTYGRSFIELYPSGYLLRLARSDVDVTRFEDAVQTRSDLAGALGLFRGAALDGLGDTLPIVAERQRLYALRLAAVELWAEDELAAGRLDEVIQRIERELVTSPWRESLWALLMVALYRANRQADALAAFQRVRVVLADELGLDPGPGLCTLERQILDHDPALLSNTVGARPARELDGAPRERRPEKASRLAPFVGRLGELERLQQRLPTSASGTVSMVVGEPGIGKTRLMRELADEAEAQGVVVLWGRSPDGDWAAPYGPIVDAVDRYIAQIEPDAARTLLQASASALVDLMPIVAELCPTVPSDRRHDADEVRNRIFEAFRRILASLASMQPVLLVLDDLHWADPATIGLLDHLARTTATSALSIVGIYRDNEVDEQHPLSVNFDTLHRAVGVERVRLRGLSHASVRDLVTEFTARFAADAEIDELRAATGGNPYYLSELIRFRNETGSDDVPDSVITTIRHRLARLAPRTQSILRIAALFDQQFPFDATRRVANLDEDDALDAIDEAISAHLIEPSDQADDYRFVHALARLAAESTINPSRLQRLHRRIATTFEEQVSPSPETLARIAAHYHASRSLPDSARGVGPTLAAAEHADQVAAHAERARYLQIAAELMTADDPCRPRTLASLAMTYVRSHQPDLAADTAFVAADLIAASEGSESACEFVCGLICEVGQAFDRPVREKHLRLYQVGLEHGAEHQTPAWAHLWVVAHARRIDEIPEWEFARRAELLDDPDYRRLLPIAATFPSANLGSRPDRALADCRATAERFKDHWPGELHILLAHYHDFVDYQTAFNERARQRRNISALVYSHAVLAFGHSMLGNFDASRQHLAEAEIARAATVPDVRHWLMLIAGHQVLYEVTDGPWDECAETIGRLAIGASETNLWQAGKERVRDNPPTAGSNDKQAISALVHARCGRPSQATEALATLLPFLEGASTAEQSFKTIAGVAAEVIWLTGDTAHLSAVERAVRGRWLPMDLDEIGRDLRLSMARLCAVDGRVDEALEWFDRARTVFNEQQMLPLLAIADHDEAWMHIRHPRNAQIDHVIELLQRCIAECERIGMPGWRDRARRLLAGAEAQR